MVARPWLLLDKFATLRIAVELGRGGKLRREPRSSWRRQIVDEVAAFHDATPTATCWASKGTPAAPVTGPENPGTKILVPVAEP